jgi:hypothetical protein
MVMRAPIKRRTFAFLVPQRQNRDMPYEIKLDLFPAGWLRIKFKRVDSNAVRICALLVCLATVACLGCASRTKATSVEFRGSVKAGEPFEYPFAHKYRFSLEPQEFGWNIVIMERGRNEQLQRLTPPLHFAPNPTSVEGWHFRNHDNTILNDGTVNAPQYAREFIFSPVVGRTVQGPGGTASVSPEEVEHVKSFGRGVLHITQLELSPLVRGEQAKILKMSFRCDITINNAGETTTLP